MDIRIATADDTPTLLAFIRAMAEFEKLEVSATEEVLRESLFGDQPAAFPILAFIDGEPAAYAVYFFSFSTMAGKRGLWLDDLFVDPKFRGRGVAKKMMAFLADIALKKDCARFEWMVLDWNQPAIDLYKGLGADFFPEWQICRLDQDNLKNVAGFGFDDTKA